MNVLDQLPNLIPASPFSAAEGVPELPNFVQVLISWFPNNPVLHWIHENPVWEGMIFAYLAAAIIVIGVQVAVRNPQMIPGKWQNFVEWLFDGLTKFITDIIGPEGKPFVPFLGTFFIYILAMNLSGVIPLGKSPTASPNTTLALAGMVFLYSNWIGLRKNGLGGYILHLAGNPKSAIEWALVPLNIPIHILGELAKPVSLALRLFGNVTGEDVLLYAFCSLGVAALSFIPMDGAIGLPLQIPFIMLAFLTSTIQALVFTLLATIYILLWLPHEEGH